MSPPRWAARLEVAIVWIVCLVVLNAAAALAVHVMGASGAFRAALHAAFLAPMVVLAISPRPDRRGPGGRP